MSGEEGGLSARVWGWSRRWAAPGVVGMVAVWQIRTALRAAFSEHQDDLSVYLLGIKAVAAGLPLYEVRAPNGDPFTYPPFAVLAMWPISWLPDGVAKKLWTIGTILVLLIMILALAARHHAAWDPPRYVAVILASFTLLLMSTPAVLNLGLGQASALITTLVLLDALELTPARWRGLCIGIAAAIKLTPLAFVVYLLVAGRVRDGLRALAAFAGSVVLTALILPTDSLAYWTNALFHMESRLGYLEYVDNQSAQAFLLRCALPPAVVSVTWFLVAASISLAALIQARILRRRGSEVHAILILGCATLIASPISWGHHMFWVVLAGLWLLWSQQQTSMATGALVLGVMLASLDLGLPPTAQHSWVGLITVNSRGLTALLLATGPLLWAAYTSSPKSPDLVTTTLTPAPSDK